MTFVPLFMLHLDEFRREREAVRSLDDWKAFFQKWLYSASWPLKIPADLKEEGERKRGPVLIGGRLWGFTFWNCDVSPEARYEYFFTLRTVGDPLKFPEEKNIPKTAAEGFEQECPYCEISTKDIGDDICPQCGRALVLSRHAK